MVVKKSVPLTTKKAPEETQQEETKQAIQPKPKIDTTKLRRRQVEHTEEIPPEVAVPVSAGPIAKALELAFNPSDEMLPSVTVIDKYQGRLFPLVDLIDTIWLHIFEIAQYRQNEDDYRAIYKRAKPISPNWLHGLLRSTAMWQKSIGGTNLTKITDIALAEMETKGDTEDGIPGGLDAWERE